MAKFVLGAQERVKKDDSIPVELLPSNKLLYMARLNSDEEPDLTPTKCTNFKEVFAKFRPSFNVDLETEEGEPINADFEVTSMKDFTSKELIEKNEHLQKTYYSKEIMADLDKQLKKNNSLKKTLKDEETREALVKVMKYYIDLLGE
ncbi:MAG: type VI secretion system contractile sheath small subunit [candidate division Zixibacteria bacterium]|nr:type VI secretion system contractile sheath small subunit [candidate division Zixibacteria bacterium]